MTTRKSNLDERQEQVLLGIEHNGCWLAFWGLLVSILAQEVIFGGEAKYIAGEWFVFMALCLYMLAACMKNGIWDRRLKPDRKTNALASATACLVVAATAFLLVVRRTENMRVAGYAALFAGLITFILCFAGLTASAAAYRKKQQEDEAEPEE